MNYRYNNDLVGKDKPWGPRSTLSPLQMTVYLRYRNMVHRCVNHHHKNYNTYGAAGVENHIISLSNYYHSLKKQTHVDNFIGADGKVHTLYSWDEFKQNPDLYDIDKDIKCGHGSSYAPDTISIVLKEDNIHEMLSRFDYSKCAVSRGRSVVEIVDGQVCNEWYGVRECARDVGGNVSTISYLCNGKHCSSRGKLKNRTFYYKDEYSRITAERN